MANVPDNWKLGNSLELSDELKLNGLNRSENETAAATDALAQNLSSMYYKPGDHYDGIINVGGVIYVNSTRLALVVFVPNRLDNVDVSVYSLRGGLRSVNGLVAGTGSTYRWDEDEAITITPYIVNAHQISLQIDKTSAFQVGSTNVTDQTPVQLLGDMYLNFIAKSA